MKSEDTNKARFEKLGLGEEEDKLNKGTYFLSSLDMENIVG